MGGVDGLNVLNRTIASRVSVSLHGVSVGVNFKFSVFACCMAECGYGGSLKWPRGVSVEDVKCATSNEFRLSR